MPKTILVLFLIFFLLLVALIGIQEYSSMLPSKLTLHKEAKSFPTPSSHSTLSFIPNQLIAPPGQPTSLNVTINSQGISPKLIQLEIAYDPTILTNMTILPGNFFINPTILLQGINEKTGRISFAIEASPEQRLQATEGSVAILQFTPRSDIFQKHTVLTFLPKTLVRTADDINTLDSTSPVTVTIAATASAVLR